MTQCQQKIIAFDFETQPARAKPRMLRTRTCFNLFLAFDHKFSKFFLGIFHRFVELSDGCRGLRLEIRQGVGSTRAKFQEVLPQHFTRHLSKLRLQGCKRSCQVRLQSLHLTSKSCGPHWPLLPRTLASLFGGNHFCAQQIHRKTDSQEVFRNSRQPAVSVLQ